MLKNLKKMNNYMKEVKQAANPAQASPRLLASRNYQAQGIETLERDLSYQMFNSFQTMDELLRLMDYQMLLRIEKRRVKKEFLVGFWFLTFLRF